MRVIRGRAKSLQRLIDEFVLPELREMHGEIRRCSVPGTLLLDVRNAGSQAKEISTILRGMILEAEGRKRSA